MKMFGWFHSPFILRIQLKSECWEMTKLFLRDVDEIAKIRKNAEKDKDRVFFTSKAFSFTTNYIFNKKQNTGQYFVRKSSFISSK